MKRTDIFSLGFTVILVLLILGYYLLYNIYEIEVKITPKQLYADINSSTEIKVIPINALGYTALFRSTKSDFEIIEGKELVEILSIDNAGGFMKLKSKGIEGKVGIKIYSKNSLFPQYIEILILPLTV